MEAGNNHEQDCQAQETAGGFEVLDQVQEHKTEPDLEGRRIVNISFLASPMFCQACERALELNNIKKEYVYGLASYFWIICSEVTCRHLNKVLTDKRHGKHTFDVNTKAALGMVNSGMGTTHVNTFLSALNLPGIHPKSLREREKEVSSAVYSVAQQSCEKARLAEAAEAGPSGITSSFDGGWSTRKSGRCYDSNTGHAAMIGECTGKVLDFAVKTKICRKCDAGNTEHECSRNWDGSSKSMEPAMAIEMLHNLEERGTPVKTLVMDNDATTLARACREFPDLAKKSDRNHSIKGLSNSLYALANTHKTLKNPKTLKYVRLMFTRAIDQMQGDPAGLKSRLGEIVPHMYGNHALCSHCWCKHHVDPNNFKYNKLPWKQPLQDQPLRKALEELVKHHQENAADLACLGCSQANESLNNSIASKAPKCRAYGGSESIKTRVASAVSQKNEGPMWVSQVNQKIGLSPGEYTLRISERLARKRSAEKTRAATVQAKRRRSELRGKHNKKEETCTLKEGDTYSSGIGASDVVDITELPSSIVVTGADKKVFFDLETTGLFKPDIVQLSAVCDNREFNRYICPTKPISAEATKVTEFTVFNNELRLHGNAVDTVQLRVALLDFLDFLKLCGATSLLIGHNIKRFDIPVLHQCMKYHGLGSTLVSTVRGCIDTLLVAHRLISKSDVPNYKQTTLVEKFVGVQYAAHDSLEDVRALKSLYAAVFAGKFNLDDHVFPVDAYVWMQSLKPLVEQKHLSTLMQSKLARTGIGLRHLRIAHQRNPDQGVSLLLKERTAFGKPRVTAQKSVVDKIIGFLS